MHDNEYYQKKYLKYKSKYLELKNNKNNKYNKYNENKNNKYNKDEDNINGGFGLSEILNGLNGIAKLLPPEFSSPEFLNAIKDYGGKTMLDFIMTQPELKKLYSSHLITKENMNLVFGILKSQFNNLSDPDYRSLIIKIITNITVLTGSAETLEIPVALTEIQELHKNFGKMKEKFPEGFNLLSDFLKKNKKQIFDLINPSISNYSGFQTEFNLLMNFIGIDM